MRWAILAACVLAGVGHAEAQVYIGGGDTPGKGAVEVGGGVMWSPGFEVGSITAELTRSGQQADPFDLFTSDGEVNGFPGLHARLGFFVSDAVSVEDLQEAIQRVGRVADGEKLERHVAWFRPRHGPVHPPINAW